MAADRTPGIKLEKVAHAVFDGGKPESLRFSTYVRGLRAQGLEASAAELEADQAKYGASCPTHGALSDPVLGILGEGPAARVAFACPQCSGPEILAAWEKEGMRS